MNENTPIRRRRTAGHAGIAAERMNDSKTQSQYEPYKEAAWGFINHWYPALFSEELPEQHVEGIQICGIPILLLDYAIGERPQNGVARPIHAADNVIFPRRVDHGRKWLDEPAFTQIVPGQDIRDQRHAAALDGGGSDNVTVLLVSRH